LYRVRDHRSLRAWREAHAANIGVIRLARDAWKPYTAALHAQLQRASLSVELNIAEGYTFGDSPTFTRHLGIAYGSAVETVELLRLGIEADALPRVPGQEILAHADSARVLLLGLVKRRRKFSP
jgi:four helix bundle protein